MFLGLAVALAVWCAVDVARRAVVDPAQPSLHMTDFTVYTAAGAAFFDGRDPYEVANLRGWKYLYPPLFALLVAPLYKLTPPLAASVWFGLSALMGFGCYFECRRLVLALSRPDRSPGRPETAGPEVQNQSDVAALPNWLFATALAAVALPALNCLQRGQMGVALLYFLLVGCRLAFTGQTWAAWLSGGIALALPIALKLTPALPAAAVAGSLLVAALAIHIRNRPPAIDTSAAGWSRFGFVGVGLVAGCLLFFLLIPSALVGWSANLAHLHTWYVKVASRVDDVRSDDFGENVASLRNQSLHNAAFRCGNWVACRFFGGPDDLNMKVTRATMPMDAPLASLAVSTTRGLALVALVCVLVRGAWRGDRLLMAAAFGLACIATLVISPVSRGHYFVFWAPAVVLVPVWFLQHGRRRAALLAALAPVVLTWLHYAALPIAGRAGLLGLGTTAWYFAVCLSVLRSADPICAAQAGAESPRADLPVRAAA
ncbi:MAG: glycosyltransferase 87 family protein [Planctomycetaceae bacterium]